MHQYWPSSCSQPAADADEAARAAAAEPALSPYLRRGHRIVASYILIDSRRIFHPLPIGLRESKAIVPEFGATASL